MKQIENGGLNCVKGWTSAGIHAGIKKQKKDIALIVSDFPASAAGVFTVNKVQAAPVRYDREVLAAGRPIRAVVVNSGNANACTGSQGYADTVTMAAAAAEAIGASDSDGVLVCSTGVIGVPLPIETVRRGVRIAAEELSDSREAALSAAEAILTTDTFRKEVAVEITIDSKPVTIAGIAKGSGMIHPDMATLLSFIITDASVEASLLQELLGTSIRDSYNMISVDGDTSTNDTVLALANGASGTSPITAGTDAFHQFKAAFDYVHAYLARQIVRDGEGASKFIEVRVSGAATEQDARLMAKAVITSNLVKTAFFGEDANWGRILCAMGYSGAGFDPEAVELTISSSAGSLLLLRQGIPQPFDEAAALEILKQHDITVAASLQDGQAEAVAWGCDLSYDYVKINGDYRT